ncbi:Lipopolysaccharide biosynthesis protein WzxC [compost metagenome]
MSSLTQASLRGIRWSALSQLLAQTAQYGSFILLARLLTPAEFGTVASATLVIGLVAMLNELGLGAAIIQRAELKPGHLNAGFWLNATAGVLFWVLMLLGASAVGNFFNNPTVVPVTMWLALSFPLIGLAVVHKALLERNLRFKAIALVDSAAAIANGGLAIGLALTGHGVWSLVVGTLAGYAVQLAGMTLASRWRPGFAFSRQEMKELVGFGVNVLGTRLFAYMSANVDYLIVGRLLGPATLGAYSLAYKLVTWPMLKISHVTLRVVYPTFSRMQHDDEALRRSYCKLTQTLALVTFPILAGLAVLAPEVVPLVFGPQWAAAVFPTQVLCFTGAMKAMVCSIGTIFMSKGRPDLEFKLNIYGFCQLTTFLLVGVQFGIRGVAIALACSSLVHAPTQQFFANRLLGLSARRFLSGLVAPVTASAVMAGVTIAWRTATLAQGWPTWLIVAGAVPLAVSAYMVTLSAVGFDWRSLARQLTGRQAKLVG